jgi:hypothetical protein
MPAGPSRTVVGLAVALALSSATPASAAAPRTIEDDYPGALAEAKRLGVPILVDVWAPW